MAHYGSAHYDSGAHYDETTAAPKPKRMPKVKLELQLKNDEDLRVFANAHNPGTAAITTPEARAA